MAIINGTINDETPVGTFDGDIYFGFVNGPEGDVFIREVPVTCLPAMEATISPRQQTISRGKVLASFMVALASALLIPLPVQADSCGGEDERPCTFFERPLLPCDTGLAEISGICIKLSPCGGKGQRACTAGERITPCNSGLTEVSGCSGDCRPGSSGTCADLVNSIIPEPLINHTPPQSAPTDPLRGYADLHVHMFSYLAMGEFVQVGAAYDPGDDFNT